MTDHSQWALAISDRLYHLLLLAYPARFRRAYGRDMEQLFRDCCRDAYGQNGALGLIGLWLPTLFEWATTTLNEHISEVCHMSSANLVRQWPEGLVRERRAGNVGILETDGYINGKGGEAVVEACEGLIREEFRHFVLNLEKVHIINSVGVAKLIEMLEKVTGLGGKVAFCNVRPTIAKTFRIMGLLKSADLFTSEEPALASMGDSEN